MKKEEIEKQIKELQAKLKDSTKIKTTEKKNKVVYISKIFENLRIFINDNLIMIEKKDMFGKINTIFLKKNDIKKISQKVNEIENLIKGFNIIIDNNNNDNFQQIYKNNLKEDLLNIQNIQYDRLFYLGVLSGKIVGFYFVDKINTKEYSKLNEILCLIKIYYKFNEIK